MKMTPKTVTVPELAMIAGTRAALGAGIGLLLAGRMSPAQQRAVGWTLFAVGVLSTIPLVTEILMRDGTPDGAAVHGHRAQVAGARLFPE